MRETITLNPNNVLVTSRLRQMDEDHVAAVTDSINAFGQLTPITVEVLDQPAGDCTHRLIAGRHRLEACRQLGIDVRAEVMHGITSEDSVALEAIENTVRLNLTCAQRVEHIRTIKDAMVRKLGRPLSTQENNAFLEEQAKRRKVKTATVKQEEALSRQIPKEVLSQVAGTKIDNLPGLARLARVKDPEEMLKRAEREITYRENSAAGGQEDKKFAAMWAAAILKRALLPREIEQLVSVCSLTDMRSLINALRGEDVSAQGDEIPAHTGTA